MIFVAEITVAVDDVGTEQTFRFSTGLGWATGPADTPAHTYIAAGMRRSGGYRRSMFADRGMFGAVRVSHGTIEIANGDGSLDAWRTYGYGRRVRVYLGAEEGLAYPGDYTLLFEARGAGARGCRLDVAALVDASMRIESSLDRDPALLVLNKFGKVEAEGGGMCGLLAKALERGIPAIIGVPERNLDAWRRFAGDFSAELAADRGQVAEWLGTVR